MSIVEEFNKAIDWAAYLGLPKIFAKMGASRSIDRPTIPTPTRMKEQPARTPTAKEVGGTQLPAVVIPPKALVTGGIGTLELSQVVPLRCQQPVNSGIWQPQKVVEKPGVLLEK